MGLNSVSILRRWTGQNGCHPQGQSEEGKDPLPVAVSEICVLQRRTGKQPVEGPWSLVPSPALCCHQGHWLGLTDRQEKPIKRLPLPVICYRR